MKNIFLIISTLTILSVSIFSCTKSEDASPEYLATDKNSLALEFENRAGDQKLVLGSTVGKNAAGEDFTITTFNYFISNIAFQKADGTTVKYPNDYFLIRQADSKSLVATLKDVPAGNYTSVSFMIGVDSTKSIADISARTGVLDPTSYGNDSMYWSWNSGYIFYKLEGTSSVVPANASGAKVFQFHVGGFGGKTTVTANNLRTITLPLTTNATVRKNIAPEIHVVVDVAKTFSGTSTISLATTNSIHSIALAKPIADNYAKSFSVAHVHNDTK